MNARLRTVLSCALLLLAGCGRNAGTAYEWQLPPGFPPPLVPLDNPLTREKIELGRRLFYDVRLSANATQACASCHRQALAFTDGAIVATGSTGALHQRNSMSLANVAYAATFTWAHPGITTLEQHMLIPLFGDVPVEMNAAGHEAEILRRLASDPQYPPLFAAAFDTPDGSITFDRITKAIASFVRTLISFGSPFDRYAFHGEDAALTPTQIRGMNLFMSERLECSHCHNGFNFSQFVTHESARVADRAFHNTGLYFLAGDAPVDFDFGLQRVTRDESDKYRFKAPTLRNIEHTAPYMHDGSIATLADVIDFYAAGGREIESGPWRGDGRRHPDKSPFIKGFDLSQEEKSDLLNFLYSLTDTEFLQNSAFSGDPD